MAKGTLTDMLPVMTRRQIINRQCRDIGLRPTDAYNPDVGLQDEVEIEEVEQEPEFHAAKFQATIHGLEDHGHYRIVVYQRADGHRGTARVNSNGVPPDWGVVAIKITRRVYVRLEPDADRV